MRATGVLTGTRGAAWAAVALVASVGLQLVAPPYYGIVADSDGRLHASLGHAVRWNAPGPDRVCDAVRDRRVREGVARLVECPPPAERRDQFQARVNLVRAVAETVAVAVVALLITWRGRPRRRDA